MITSIGVVDCHQDLDGCDLSGQGAVWPTRYLIETSNHQTMYGTYADAQAQLNSDSTVRHCKEAIVHHADGILLGRI